MARVHRCWSFTHYKLLDIDKIWEASSASLAYLCGQVEKCPSTGSLHIQGMVITPHRVGKATIQKLLLSPVNDDSERTLNVLPLRSDSEILKTYCSKDETKVESFKEFGVFDYVKRNTKAGQDQLLALFIEDIQEGFSLADLRMRHANMYLNYNKQFIELYHEYSPIEEVPDIELNAWEQKIIDVINKPQRDREIYWVYDLVGGAGKSTFVNYIAYHYKNVFVTDGGCHRDIAYAYDKQPIVLFDYPRDASQLVNYSVLECLKNGRITSSKYQSVTKIFKKPHIIVFANFLPDTSRMSADKWRIIDVIDYQ